MAIWEIKWEEYLSRGPLDRGDCYADTLDPIEWHSKYGYDLAEVHPLRPGVLLVHQTHIDGWWWLIFRTEAFGSLGGSESAYNFSPAEVSMAAKKGIRRSNGLLVYLTIRTWGGSIKDHPTPSGGTSASPSKSAKAKDKELTSQYTVGKILAKDEELKPIKNEAQRLRHLTVAFCEPADDIAPGAKFLMTKNYKLYKEKADEIVARLDQAVVDFVRTYPKILAEGPQRLGSGWDPADYPTAQEIRSCFGVELQFRPLPGSEETETGSDEKPAEETQEVPDAAKEVESRMQDWGT